MKGTIRDKYRDKINPVTEKCKRRLVDKMLEEVVSLILLLMFTIRNHLNLICVLSTIHVYQSSQLSCVARETHAF